MIVSNATPLIYLAKLGRLHLLKAFFQAVIIPEEVKREVVDRGKEQNSIDAFLVEEALKKGWIKIKKVQLREDMEALGIDKGEAEAISLAVELNSDEILVDQTHARLAATMFGLKPRGTIYVLIRALNEDIFDYDEYLKILEDLVRSGFRMSDEVYLEAVRLGKKRNKE
jgi:predicted nucleic acid-binding protein